MNQFYFKILIISTTFSMGFVFFGQHSVNSSGGSGTGIGGNVSYSIGQVVYNQSNGISGSVEEGVQHTYTIESLGVENTKNSGQFYVYPNPTTDIIILKSDNYNDAKINYSIYDASGKSLTSGKAIYKETPINLAKIPSGIYTIVISSSDNKSLQSFKIIKK